MSEIPTSTQTPPPNSSFKLKPSFILPQGTLFSANTSDQTVKNTTSTTTTTNTDSKDNILKTGFIGLADKEAKFTQTKESETFFTEKKESPDCEVRNKPFVFGKGIQDRVLLPEKTITPTSEEPQIQQTTWLNDTSPRSISPTSSSQPELFSGKSEKHLLDTLPQAIVLNGEEDEYQVIEMSCKLYMFDASIHNWVNKGRVTLHLNDSINKPNRSRIIARLHGTQRVVLNSYIWADMICEKADVQSIRISAQIERDVIKIFLILGEKRDIAELYSPLSNRIFNSKLHKKACIDKEEARNSSSTKLVECTFSASSNSQTSSNQSNFDPNEPLQQIRDVDTATTPVTHSDQILTIGTIPDDSRDKSITFNEKDNNTSYSQPQAETVFKTESRGDYPETDIMSAEMPGNSNEPTNYFQLDKSKPQQSPVANKRNLDKRDGQKVEGDYRRHSIGSDSASDDNKDDEDDENFPSKRQKS